MSDQGSPVTATQSPAPRYKMAVVKNELDSYSTVEIDRVPEDVALLKDKQCDPDDVKLAEELVAHANLGAAVESAVKSPGTVPAPGEPELPYSFSLDSPIGKWVGWAKARIAELTTSLEMGRKFLDLAYDANRRESLRLIDVVEALKKSNVNLAGIHRNVEDLKAELTAARKEAADQLDRAGKLEDVVKGLRADVALRERSSVRTFLPGQRVRIEAAPADTFGSPLDGTVEEVVVGRGRAVKYLVSWWLAERDGRGTSRQLAVLDAADVSGEPDLLPLPPALVEGALRSGPGWEGGRCDIPDGPGS